MCGDVEVDFEWPKAQNSTETFLEVLALLALLSLI
jgi:hypothetical protein